MAVSLLKRVGKEREVLAMENGGNKTVNMIFEARLNTQKPSAGASGQTRERFIRDKYERRKFFDPDALRQFHERGSGDDSDDENSSEEEKIAIRTPSDAARKRAEARKKKSGGS
eukprot:672855-Ditylum_brightwellii.AAC.1